MGSITTLLGFRPRSHNYSESRLIVELKSTAMYNVSHNYNTIDIVSDVIKCTPHEWYAFDNMTDSRCNVVIVAIHPYIVSDILDASTSIACNTPVVDDSDWQRSQPRLR